MSFRPSLILRTTFATLLAGALTAPVAVAGEAAPGPLEWGACPAGSFADPSAECADIEVPKDYSTPDAGTITLTMSRIAATGERKGVIAGNPGGPGGDALSMFTSSDIGSPEAEGRIALPADVRESYDLLAVEPRGLAWGTPLDCGTPGMPAADMLAACEANDPGYAATVTTDNTARDLDEARKALGEQTLNLYGISYGGPLMATYATLFPGTTGKVLLDSSASPEQRWFGLGQVRKQARVDGLNAMFSWLAERDDEYHLGTTPLQVYQRWAEVVAGPYGVQLPTAPPAAGADDVPLPGRLASQVVDAVVYAQWRAGTLSDTTRMLLGDESALTGVSAGRQGLMDGLYSEKVWPVIGEQLSNPGAQQGGQPQLSEEEAAALELMQTQSTYVDRAIVCNENATAADPSLVVPTLVTQYTGGDLIRYNEDLLGSGLYCDGWPATTVPTDPSGAELEQAPLHIGYSHDTAVTAAGATDMHRAMGGELLVTEGFSHGVQLEAPATFEDEISAYFA
ncbi:alpha/beta fold hydrolase [Corynebacterium sp.]|uniref:alpha/beta fold hydrolase n=1 Tax=Corynebacterium sp. TaxID=1720 RepID=UPI003B3BBE23